jgi:plasmid segregation protein ParM
MIEPSFSQQPIAIGVDGGYSFTKYAFMQDGRIVTGSIPSVARRASGIALGSMIDGVGAREADLQIDVKGVTYLVDTSDSEVVASSVIRSETDDFPQTDEYVALVGAALVQCQQRVIDELVLGLPFSTYQLWARPLIETFRGKHDFGRHGTFVIHNVSILPQPLGTYVFLRATNPKAFVQDTSCCIVDCGWNTTDTFVSSPSFKIDRARCGGLQGGAAIVLREIATLLQRKYTGRFSNLDRIDRAIVSGKPLIHGGEEIDLQPFLNAASHVTIPIARSVLSTIKTPEDLTVFAAGGAAHYYLPALRETLGCNIHLVEQPRFANATGFLLAGEAKFKGKR